MEKIEIIIINDGSTDVKTLQALEKISSNTPSNIKVINQENLGPSSARNAGLTNATGKWVSFCDSDDIVIPRNLSKLISYLPKNNSSDMLILGWNITHSNTGEINRSIKLKNQTIIGDEIIIKTLISLGQDGRMYNLWNKLYRKNIITSNDLRLDTNLKFGEDLLFNLDFLGYSQKIKMLNIDPYYTYLDDSPTSIVKNTKLNLNFRKINNDKLSKFAERTSSNVNSIVQFVKARWLGSFIIAILSQDKKLFRRISDARKVFFEKPLLPTSIKSIGHISQKKYIILQFFILTTKIPFTTNHVGGMFGIFFTTEKEIRTYQQVMTCDVPRFKKFFHGMLDLGVYLAPSAFEAGFISAAHTRNEIEFTLDCAAKVFATL